jgi:hypothetical protein
MMSVVGADFSRVAAAIMSQSQLVQVCGFLSETPMHLHKYANHCAKQGACRLIQEFKGAALAQQARRRARFLSATLLWIGKHGHGDLVCRKQFLDLFSLL